LLITLIVADNAHIEKLPVTTLF